MELSLGTLSAAITNNCFRWNLEVTVLIPAKFAEEVAFHVTFAFCLVSLFHVANASKE